MEEKIWKVYKHTNPSNKKSYIGITSKDDPNERWKNGQGYRNHYKFYCAIQHYGWEYFTHEILLTNLTYEEACQKEKELIIYYDSKNNGYNASDGGIGSHGYKHSEEDKQKISEKLKIYNSSIEVIDKKSKDMKKSWENNEKRRQQTSTRTKALWVNHRKELIEKRQKKVLCINTGVIFNSINEAAKWANIHASGISCCLSGKQKTSGKHPETKEPLQWKLI